MPVADAVLLRREILRSAGSVAHADQLRTISNRPLHARALDLDADELPVVVQAVGGAVQALSGDVPQILDKVRQSGLGSLIAGRSGALETLRTHAREITCVGAGSRPCRSRRPSSWSRLGALFGLIGADRRRAYSGGGPDRRGGADRPQKSSHRRRRTTAARLTHCSGRSADVVFTHRGDSGGLRPTASSSRARAKADRAADARARSCGAMISPSGRPIRLPRGKPSSARVGLFASRMRRCSSSSTIG